MCCLRMFKTDCWHLFVSVCPSWCLFASLGLMYCLEMSNWCLGRMSRVYGWCFSGYSSSLKSQGVHSLYQQIEPVFYNDWTWKYSGLRHEVILPTSCAEISWAFYYIIVCNTFTVHTLLACIVKLVNELQINKFSLLLFRFCSHHNVILAAKQCASSFDGDKPGHLPHCITDHYNRGPSCLGLVRTNRFCWAH